MITHSIAFDLVRHPALIMTRYLPNYWISKAATGVAGHFSLSTIESSGNRINMI
jgi:hypothetical protein